MNARGQARKLQYLSALVALALLLAAAACMTIPRAAYADSDHGLAAGSVDLTAQATPSVSYKAHVQDIGWQDYVSNGAMAGTSGRALRLEGINIKVSGMSGGVAYTTHVQDVGWQNEVADDAMAGTSGRALRLEGIKVRLTGQIAQQYDIVYRVHVQDIGWMNWVANGALAGTTGQAKRLEAIEIKLLAKSQTPSTPNSELEYVAHVQDIGWQDYVGAGKTAGTTGRAKQVEAVRIASNLASSSGTIEYSTHVAFIGWQDYVSNNAIAGTTGRALQMEALRVRLTGNLASQYDVYYRAHVRNWGWLDWAKNGEDAGSTGMGLAMEAFEIVLVSKGDSAPGATDAPTANVKKRKLNGIDISSWQEGINIAGVDADFVIVKATQGTTYINPFFRQWADDTLASGKLLGLYHFAVTGDAIAQADYFVTQAGPYIRRAVLFLDWENNDLSGDPTLLQGPSWAKRFLDRVHERTGVRPLIYMSKNVTRAYDWSSVAPTYGLWVAQYPDYKTTGYQSEPWTDSYGFGAWSAPTLFQYTSTGRISGYGGNLDLDLFYGTIDDWKALQAAS